jgi:hypothetical protein
MFKGQTLGQTRSVVFILTYYDFYDPIFELSFSNALAKTVFSISLPTPNAQKQSNTLIIYRASFHITQFILLLGIVMNVTLPNIFIKKICIFNLVEANFETIKKTNIENILFILTNK